MTKPIYVSIVEDDAQIRSLTQIIIDGSPGYVCKSVFENVDELMANIEVLNFEILLLDVDLPKISGIEGLARIKECKPSIKVIMYTVHEDDETIFDALCAGADGYLVKGMPPHKVLLALSEASQGGAPMSKKIARKVITFFHRGHDHNLSKREREVLKLLVEGENYKSIASKLFVSSNTVKTHIKNIYSKLYVNSRAEAVALAINKRLI